MKWIWECGNCGNEMSKEDFEEWAEHKDEVDASTFRGMTANEVSSIILVDCPKCDEELAEYEKNASESTDSSNTTTRSKMLQAARS